MSDEQTMKKEPGSAYEIIIRDHLETYWTSYFEGWSIENLKNGKVRLSKTNVDQASLHGVLDKILNLNLRILLVKKMDVDQDQNG